MSFHLYTGPLFLWCQWWGKSFVKLVVLHVPAFGNRIKNNKDLEKSPSPKRRPSRKVDKGLVLWSQRFHYFRKSKNKVFFFFFQNVYSFTWQISEYNDVQWRINTTAITVWHWRPGECQDSIFYSLLSRLVTWHGCNNSSTSMEISCPEEDICCSCWMTALSRRLMRRGSTSLLASSRTSRQLTGLTLVGGRSV